MSDSLDILDADQAAALPLDWPDVYFTPAYGRAIEALNGWTWRVAIWGAGRIIFPFLMRPIDRSIAVGQGAYDAVSPYGYSGTAALGPTTSRDWKAFREAWRRTAAAMNIVGEFQRFSPFVAGHEALCEADDSIDVHKHNTIVTVPCESLDEYWKSASGMVRNRVRHARKLGYTAAVSTVSEGDIAAGSPLRSIYERTMRRVAATGDYIFPDAYYYILRAQLGDALQVCTTTDADGRTVAAGLLFHWNTIAHFHLAGSDRAARRDGCNVLRLDAQIRWASEAGCAFVNLGGGRDDNDPLFRFKANFSSDRRPFNVGTAILDIETGSRLAQRGYAP